MPTPPALEVAMGMGTYLTAQPGIGGRLRGEPEDFQVIELGPGPKPAEDGRFAAARIRLRNWETNRFAGQAAKRLKIRRGGVGFAGMKDKRAVTEQWFTFQARSDRLDAIAELQDVEILETRRTASKQFAGAHDGNRFVLRVRGHNGDLDSARAILADIAAAGGVPHYFGPQRFGSAVRPITPRMGEALVRGELEEAVRLYCGEPMPDEREDTHAARTLYEQTRDAVAALEAMPPQLDLERSILQRLTERPDEWAFALKALPPNLLTLFIHSYQSLAFNRILTARIEAGLGIREAHIGDRVMAIDDDGIKTHLVTAANQGRVQQEIQRGRAAPTAILPGMEAPLAEGEPGEIERRVMDEMHMHPRDFRCHHFPALASPGRRRSILQRVDGLHMDIIDGDPVVSFALGRGSYATIVMREVMKADIDAY